MKRKKMDDQAIECVAGGTREEMDEIIAVFRKHGYESEAVQLEQAGSVFFGRILNKIMIAMQFPERLSVFQREEEPNRNILKGKRVSHAETIAMLDKFLSRS